MVNDVRRFRCPCCHKPLEIETRSGRVRAITVAPGEDVDALLEKHKQESERLGDAFERAAKDVATQKDKFDDLFNSALDDAKQNPDEKPRNPFELD